MPVPRFTHRTVIVFGAAGALGAGVAGAFAADGASVTGVDVDQSEPAADRRLEGVSYRTADARDDTSLAALFGSVPVPWAVVNTVGGVRPCRPAGGTGSRRPGAELGGRLSPAWRPSGPARQRPQRPGPRFIHGG